MTPAADLGLALFAAHLSEDFILRGERAADSGRRPGPLALHAARRAALAYILAGRWTQWPAPVTVFCVQGAIDLFTERTDRRGIGKFLGGQALHLAAVVLIAAGFGGGAALGFWIDRFGSTVTRILVAACGGTICVRVAAVVVGFWVQPYLDEIRRSRPSDSEADYRGLKSGGRVIGQWERGLIFLFVLMGQPGAVGFLIAAKSVFRFGELSDRHNRMEAEYITIGTLMSFGLAVAVAELTRRILRGTL